MPVLLLLVVAGCGHGEGDPDGRVFAELRQLRSAIPIDATSVSATEYSDATWSGGCADGTGHAGWEKAMVYFKFTDRDPASSVVGAASTRLARIGWRRLDVVLGRGQGPVAEWLHPGPYDTTAVVNLYPVPAGSTSWFLTGNWQPPGPADHGDCV